MVVAVHRWKPIQRSVAYYEGMRVAPEVRRQGVGRAMLRAAVEQVRGLGYEVLRLASGNPHALALFESEGFRPRARAAVWQAGRQEGGEPARMPPAADADRLLRALEADPALALYDRLDPLPSGPRDVDGAYLSELRGSAAAGCTERWSRAPAGPSRTCFWPCVSKPMLTGWRARACWSRRNIRPRRTCRPSAILSRTWRSSTRCWT